MKLRAKRGLARLLHHIQTVKEMNRAENKKLLEQAYELLRIVDERIKNGKIPVHRAARVRKGVIDDMI